MSAAQAGKNYPAPYAIVDCIETGVRSGHAEGSKVERAKFGELGMTKESQALRGIFFSQTETKKNPFGKAKRDVAVRTCKVLLRALMWIAVGVSGDVASNVTAYSVVWFIPSPLLFVSEHSIAGLAHILPLCLCLNPCPASVVEPDGWRVGRGLDGRRHRASLG